MVSDASETPNVKRRGGAPRGPRTYGRLTARTVAAAGPKVDGAQIRPAMYPDGGGLYLQVTPHKGLGSADLDPREANRTASRSWLFRFSLNGRVREMGLGPLRDIGLAEARELAVTARRLVRDGVDPIEHRERERLARAAAAPSRSFKVAAETYIESHRAGWRNAKHADQWGATLKAYVFPVFGDHPVDAVDLELVLKVLQPIWTKKPETASRVRGRIETILDWAAVQKLRKGENPARWRGHLDHLLPARGKVRKVVHHAALAFSEIPGFMALLREQQGLAARALEFTILTAARTSETLDATWSEMDLKNMIWTIPATRMKAGKDHRVPLTTAVVALLRVVEKIRQNEFIFPGQKLGRPLSNMSMLQLLERMERDVTVHGFRSSFRDWAAEKTKFENHVVEMALAHAIGDAVEASYRRGELFDKRRKLMDAWGSYCTKSVSAGAVVVPFGKGGGQ